MSDESLIVWGVLGALVSAVLLYAIIRVAVSHGIRDVRRRDVEDADRAAARAAGIRPSHLDGDGL